MHHPRGFERAGGTIAARAPAPPANSVQRFPGRGPRHGRLVRRPGDAERASAAPARSGDWATGSSTSVQPPRPRLPLALVAVRGSGFQRRSTPQPSRASDGNSPPRIRPDDEPAPPLGGARRRGARQGERQRHDRPHPPQPGRSRSTDDREGPLTARTSWAYHVAIGGKTYTWLVLADQEPPAATYLYAANLDETSGAPGAPAPAPRSSPSC